MGVPGSGLQLAELRISVCACVGERALALWDQGCTRSLMRAVLYVLSCFTCPVRGVRLEL